MVENKTKYKVRAYTLTEELIQKVENAAKKQDRNASSIIRQALIKYFGE